MKTKKFVKLKQNSTKMNFNSNDRKSPPRISGKRDRSQQEDNLCDTKSFYEILSSHKNLETLTIKLTSDPMRQVMYQHNSENTFLCLDYGRRTIKSNVSTFSVIGLDKPYSFQASTSYDSLNFRNNVMVIRLHDRYSNSRLSRLRNFNVISIKQLQNERDIEIRRDAVSLMMKDNSVREEAIKKTIKRLTPEIRSRLDKKLAEIYKELREEMEIDNL